MSGFFKCQKRGLNDRTWQGNQFLTQIYYRCLTNIDWGIVATAEEALKILPVRWKWLNSSSAERSAIASVLDQDVRYNQLDKSYGSTLYSRELFREQCCLQLEDAFKGAYCRISSFGQNKGRYPEWDLTQATRHPV
jgi:hypothetical protein